MPLYYAAPGSVIDGISAKTAVRAATTTTLPANTAPTNLTLVASANGALTAQDGITLVAGDRLLVKNEAAQANNGIYEVTAVGTAGTPYVLTRTSDFNQWSEIPSAFVPVSEGSTLADTFWVCTSDGGGTLGTTAITFSQFGNGNVTSSGNITDNAIVRGDGGAKGIQGSDLTIGDLTGGNVTVTGGAANLTLLSGTGNSRTMTLQTTTSGGTATNALVISGTQRVTVSSTETSTSASTGSLVTNGGIGCGQTLTAGTNIIGQNMTLGGYIGNYAGGVVMFIGSSAGASVTKMTFDFTPTSSTMGIGVSSSAITIYRGDGSNGGTFNVTGTLNAASGVATPVNGSSSARILLGTTANLGLYYGSGAPTVTAAKGSVYLRTDGSGVNDRMYVATDSAGAWTAVVTVA